MLKNYIKIAWRSLLRNRSTFVINVTGLAIGISSFLMILLYVTDEWSYDRHFKDSERIFRTVLHAKMGDEQIDEASVMAPVGKTFQREIPEVESSLRLAKMADATMVSYNDRQTRKGMMALADSNFFEFFSLTLLKGDALTALSKPRSVVLTKEQALTYFGNEEALNKTIEIKEIGIWSENGFENLAGFYTVTGIMEELT